ncbi:MULTISPECIES: DNA-processing protein DprA [Pseudoalteromonas]|uniref:DNA-processing protein DprA n=1 Tax=Pseudoalteromonas TaxID=53246 RepID=UPI000C34C75D|nr:MULTISPECIES: DNA-processing protein DprA [Pseudoalteromonas]PKG63276.1 DNA-processing protein DprA [Pseudoalteromonas arctica]PKG69591.1 DNA-processing protein DprA [Pseudoalteromonas sp. GutCa3]
MINNTSVLTYKLLALRFIKGVGPATLRDVLEFVILDKKDMIQMINRTYHNIDESSYSDAESLAKKELEIADRLGHRIISVFDSCYPISLLTLNSSPLILYIAGNIDYINEKNAAVIGTRDPTIHGAKIAERITSWLCENKWNIVSGLAKGIDTIAHTTCLKLGMRTTAVLAQGLDTKVYPKENIGLAENIINSGGALISEYSYGTSVRGALLVQRDKIQAALSAGVFLTQSGEKGGSLHASREILKYNRPLIVVGQSKPDVATNETKALANLILLGDDNIKIRKLLQVNQLPIDNIVKLHSKNEYSVALSALNKSFKRINDGCKDELGISSSFQF